MAFTNHLAFPSPQPIMNNAPIHLVVALPAEAKPLNRHFGLRRDNQEGPYPVFRNGHLNLLISGTGKAAAAKATQWLHGAGVSYPRTGWINLGIAGHIKRPIGMAVIASHIVDNEDGREWATKLLSPLPCDTDKVITLERQTEHYPDEGVIDMEAAGFYPEACHHTSPDRVFCLKIISDNLNNPTHEINGKKVSRLIEGQLKIVTQLIQQMESI